MGEVEKYLESLDAPQREGLMRIREIIMDSVPSAIESISYGMPAFKYKDRPLMYYGAFKNHMSIFPTSSPIAGLKAKLSKFSTAKGTIQFTEKEPVPEKLIQELLSARIVDIEKSR